MYQRFCRWSDKSIWEKLLEQLVSEPDLKWIMIDAAYLPREPEPALFESFFSSKAIFTPHVGLFSDKAPN